METNAKKLKQLYAAAKAVPAGKQCNCPSCGTPITKKRAAQVFCGGRGDTACKDNYWNNVTPSKRNNTTRISPASARFTADRLERVEDYDDDPSWDAHKSY